MEDPVPVKEEYTYQVGKIQFIVTPVYKDKGESILDRTSCMSDMRDTSYFFLSSSFP